MKANFGSDAVVFDVDMPSVDVDIGQPIQKLLEQCDVMLVIIGDKWLERDRDGRPLLENPDDWVRLEIETALQQNTLRSSSASISIIPVLVGDSNMPSKSQMPASIADLVHLQAVEVRAGTFVQAQLDHLIELIKDLRDSKGTHSSDS